MPTLASALLSSTYVFSKNASSISFEPGTSHGKYRFDKGHSQRIQIRCGRVGISVEQDLRSQIAQECRS